MVGEPDAVYVEELEFDAANIGHLAQHGLTPATIFEVLLNVPRFFENLPGRGGSHVMIGPDANDSYYYIALAMTHVEGRWRPLTGWHLQRARARRLYERGT